MYINYIRITLVCDVIFLWSCAFRRGIEKETTHVLTELTKLPLKIEYIHAENHLEHTTVYSVSIWSFFFFIS